MQAVLKEQSRNSYTFPRVLGYLEVTPSNIPTVIIWRKRTFVLKGRTLVEAYRTMRNTKRVRIEYHEEPSMHLKVSDLKETL